MSTEALATSTIDLPRDLATCHAIIQSQEATIHEQQSHIGCLEHRLAQFVRHRFGRRSEKMDAGQLRLFTAEDQQPQSTVVDEAPDAAAPRTGDGKARRKRGGGRKPLPAELPRVPVVYELPEDQLVCPHSGKPLVKIGQDVSEQLEFIPSSLFVIRHIRCKYAPEGGDGPVYIADKPRQPIEKGLPGPGLLAQVAVSKYGDHIPLHRLERIFKRHGMELARSTTCRWMGALSQLLRPLTDRMRDRILQSKVIQTDDTPIPTQVRGRGSTRTSRLWIYRGDGRAPFTVLDYTADRSRAGPARWLNVEDEQRRYRGYLQADAYSAYDAFFGEDRMTEVGCWAHARRKFHDARMTCPGVAHQVLACIGQLYEVERQAKQRAEQMSEPLTQVRLELRTQHSRAILEKIKSLLESESIRQLPRSPIGEAIGYARGNWPALCRYLDDGDLEIDNNAAERELRGVAIGRKNYLFVGSDNGGHTAATLYSLITSATRHGHDPYHYLLDVIDRISDHPANQLDDLLPDRWKPLAPPPRHTTPAT